MNKTLQKYLDMKPAGSYKKAKKLLDSMSLFCGIHGWTEKAEGSDELNNAVDNIPREDEVAINMRFKKEAIKNDPNVAEFVSLLFDLIEQYNKKKDE